MSEPADIDDAGGDSAQRYFVLDLQGVSTGTLAQALHRTQAEAALYLRRNRYMLLSRAPLSSPRDEEIARCGVNVIPLPVPAVEAARRPERALGGDPAQGLFLMEPDRQPRHIGADAVILHVWGAIRRERLLPEGRPRSRHEPDGGLRSYRARDDGLLVHVHTLSGEHPLEIDVDAFEFGHCEPSPTSSFLRILTGLRTLSATAHEDRTFRFEVPILGRPRAPGSGPLGAASRLLGGSFEDGASRNLEWLDNTDQFRFHSAWRGVLERQLRG
jgi:hypothetical protein